MQPSRCLPGQYAPYNVGFQGDPVDTAALENLTASISQNTGDARLAFHALKRCLRYIELAINHSQFLATAQWQKLLPSQRSFSSSIWRGSLARFGAECVRRKLPRHRWRRNNGLPVHLRSIDFLRDDAAGNVLLVGVRRRCAFRSRAEQLAGQRRCRCGPPHHCAGVCRVNAGAELPTCLPSGQCARVWRPQISAPLWLSRRPTAEPERNGGVVCAYRSGGTMTAIRTCSKTAATDG